jgi:NADPH:quinone reductase
MKAQLVRGAGAADVFALSQLPKPSAIAGQVLVRIHATSVNTADLMARSMGDDLFFVPKFPAVLGMDFAGVVEEVGPGVNGLAVGDEVYGCAGGVRGHGGAMAEYIAADAQLVVKKPRSLSMVEAAALPLVSITAWQGLFDRLDIRAGQQVLVHGGAGGVGHVAVQLAVAAGAKVSATGTGQGQLAVIAKLGAIPIDYVTEGPEQYVARITNGQGFDAVFDTVGNANIVPSLQAARLNGAVATTVALSPVDLTVAHVKGLTLHVVFMLIPMLHDLGKARHTEILQEVATWVDQGKVRPIVDSKHALEHAAKAHARLESGQAIGKVVIAVA